MKSKAEFVMFDSRCEETFRRMAHVTVHRADDSVVVVEVDGKFGKATKNPTENTPMNCKYFARLLAAYRAMKLKELENNLLNEYDGLLISTDEEVLKKIIFLVKNSAGFTSSQSRTFEAIKGLLKETGRL